MANTTSLTSKVVRDSHDPGGGEHTGVEVQGHGEGSDSTEELVKKEKEGKQEVVETCRGKTLN